MTRILITGAAGMLGQDLQKALAGHEVTPLSRAELDVTDAAAVDAAVAGHDVVVNAAAYTRVDDAESHQAEALAINGTAAGLLAEASARHGARLIQLSTDYVFDGTATAPYPEDAATGPISVYGSSKLAGEQLALAAHPDGTWVLRTAWLYGAGGPNFVAAILGQAAKRETFGVVTDSQGQPTWTVDVARQIREVIERRPEPGIYHSTNSGVASRYEFARRILELVGLDPDRVEPTLTGPSDRPAARPAYSVLGHDRWVAAGIEPLRPWDEALSEYLGGAASAS
ncbi:dTDP-4-dehydrorhamnose reductase [Galbitalea soli]|uniref:dTDP-4-dehydrorhamnose reductase n=1 Tax=Galbitalea soli TaxID=1268042 RepID=A0A7C9PND8_9MICO|nr:dTDP-4-dehydrorhamnose reductase [Galbitalea soli]NEM91329.1 dTDP-4-dehydrorhamnose reductase [Galbitalea soli]NYJ30019.1 dTDP-4-dehydrorhamnose reductase [Galbitalea soli]